MPKVAWTMLRNPVISHPSFSFKDQSVMFNKKDSLFYILCSSSSLLPRKVSFVFRTKDFSLITRQAIPYYGSSPDIAKFGDFYYVVFQREHPVLFWKIFGKVTCDIFKIREIAIAVTPDLSLFPSCKIYRGPKHLVPGRCIDGTIAFDSSSGKCFVAYRRWKRLYISETQFSTCTGGIFPPAPLQPGRRATLRDEKGREVDFSENFQFVTIDQELYLIATIRKEGLELDNPYTSNHFPAVFKRVNPCDWYSWVKVSDIVVPRKVWNSKMVSNTFSVLDLREDDGYIYGFFSGTDNPDFFNKRGHNKIGICRARDLLDEVWEVPTSSSAV